MSNVWRLYDRIQMHAANMPSKSAYFDVETGSTLTYRDLFERIQVDSVPATYHIIVQESRAIDLPPKILSGLLANRAVYLASSDAAQAEVSSAVALTQSIQAANDSCGELLLTSSGTTGLPKIVRRSRHSLDIMAQTIVQTVGFSPDDKIIAAIPLTHSYGLEHCFLASLWAGCTTLLCRGLNTAHIQCAIEAGATIFPAVPSMIELLGQLMPQSQTFHQLRLVYSAGAILPVRVAERFEMQWKSPVGQIYGLTELGSVVYRPPGRCEYGLVGKPFPGVSVQIISTDGDRQVLANGEQGEIAIRAESMMAGYVGAEMQCVNGHILTGDLGKIDPSGDLRLTGRLRLLIDVGGAKVNPLEVEAVLNEHPDVSISIVLPLRLSETIQKVRAVVVPVNPESPPDPDSLRQFVRQRLSAYKVPRVIHFQSSVPRSPTGKILRHAMETV